jgi:hypothetical protein
MDNETIIKEFIIENLKLSNGSCGIPMPKISNETAIPYKEVLLILRDLYKQKLFSIREGLNGKMIFKK